MRLNISPIHHPIHTMQLNNTPVNSHFEAKSRIFSNNHEWVIIIVAPRAAKIVKSVSIFLFLCDLKGDLFEGIDLYDFKEISFYMRDKCGYF